MLVVINILFFCHSRGDGQVESLSGTILEVLIAVPPRGRMTGMDGHYFQGSATAHHGINKVVGDGLMDFHPGRHSMSGVGIDGTHCSFCCVQHKKNAALF